MNIDIVFIVLLIGHVLADFYFQTEKLAEKKKTKISAVFLHSLIYFIIVPTNSNSINLVCAVSFAHLITDLIKFYFETKSNASSWIKKHLFVVDQLAHFILLLICWYIWGQNAEVRWFVKQEIIYLPFLPITILLGVLLILKPVSLFITNTEIWNKKVSIVGQGSNQDIKDAGKIIGYMERLIIFLFLRRRDLCFYLVKIESNKNLAEYYLIGTLLSVVSVLTVTVLLGLCVKSSS